MSGTKTSYTAENADVRLRYAPNEWAVVRLWFPAGYETRTDMPVVLEIPGGGWDGAHSLTFLDVHDPYATELAGGPASIWDAFLNAGWVIGRLEWPPGMNVNPQSRFNPVSCWPSMPRMIGRCVQFLKTHAEDALITGSLASTLATKSTRYALNGVSSGGIEATWIALQPDGFLKYDDRFPQRGGRDPYVYRYNHRVGAVFADDAICDFGKLTSQGISSAATPRFGPREEYFSTPAFASVPHWQKTQSSVLHMAEQNLVENQFVGIFQTMDEGSIPVGQSSPQLGAQGSYLGSGTTISFSGTVTGAPIIGETVSDGTTTGTLKGYNATSKFLYIQRNMTSTFAGVTLTGLTSGFTLPLSGTIIGGNNNRLAFLSSEEALAIWDAAGIGEIADATHEHEQIFGAALRRVLVQKELENGTNIHRHYIGNDYVAGLTQGHQPAFLWNTQNEIQVKMDWITKTLGIVA